MGPPAADKALKEAMAMGCDAGVLITDKAFSGSDTWATSYALSRAIANMGRYDLILAGERATDEAGVDPAGIKDFGSMEIIGYSMSARMTKELAQGDLEKFLRYR